MSQRDEKKEASFEKLNSRIQRIWEEGFTISILQDLKKAKEVNDGATLFERIPQAQQSGLSKGPEVLTAAGIISRGCPGTESETRQIYDMDDLGYKETGLDCGMFLNYRTDTLYIGDLDEKNVIKGKAGIYAIDADCHMNTRVLMICVPCRINDVRLGRYA